MSETKIKKDNRPVLIVFGILIVCLIVFTILLLKPKPIKYTTTFGDNITSTITIIDKKINMDVVVNEKTKVTQSGTLTLLDSGKDEDGSEWTIYEATLTKDKETEIVQIKVYDKTLILAYDSGETVIYNVK